MLFGFWRPSGKSCGLQLFSFNDFIWPFNAFGLLLSFYYFTNLCLYNNFFFDFVIAPPQGLTDEKILLGCAQMS